MSHEVATISWNGSQGKKNLKRTKQKSKERTRITKGRDTAKVKKAILKERITIWTGVRRRRRRKKSLVIKRDSKR